MASTLSFTATLIICIILGAGALISAILFFVELRGKDAEEKTRYGMRMAVLAALFAFVLINCLIYPSCSNCGEKVNTDYCTHCGEIVKENITPVCPRCGNVWYTDFCGDCGTPMDDNVPFDPS